MANLAAKSLFTSDPGANADPTGSAVRLWDSLPDLKGRVATQSAFVSSDEREVADIVRKAMRDADKLRQDAIREAAALSQSARDEAERTRQNAFVDGYAAGLTKAKEEVSQELEAKYVAKCDALRTSVESVIDGIIDERETMWNTMESEITTLALEIARKIIKIEVAQNPDAIKAVVIDSIRRVTDRASVRVIVNPDDLKEIRTSREELLQVIDGIKNLVIDADRRVGRGGCMIETAAGSIDSKVDTQLEQVERAMRG